MSDNVTISRAELEALRRQAETNDKLTLKVGAKGGVVIGGLGGRYPLTLYVEQFDKLSSHWPEITSWVEANRRALKTK
jgi:hypothetical protein